MRRQGSGLINCDAVRAGLHEVSVIHGKGTGALRKLLRIFKEPPSCKILQAWQMKVKTGVTVVKLKNNFPLF